MQSMKYRWGSGEDNAVHAERWDCRPGIKQVRMITDFTQLHQDVDNAHEMTRRQRLLRPDQRINIALPASIHFTQLALGH